MHCSRPVVVSYMRGSPLASLTISTRSLLPVPPSIAVACQQSEELKALPTRTTSPSTTHTRGPCLANQHSVTNALNYSRTTKSGLAQAMGAVASVTATSTSPSCALPRTCDVTRTSARYLAGTTITAATVPQMLLGGLPAS